MVWERDYNGTCSVCACIYDVIRAGLGMQLTVKVNECAP